MNDHVFRNTGYYSGNDSGINFAVIDPRIHDITVWIKQRDSIRDIFKYRSLNHYYRSTAISTSSHVFTNGPFMVPGGPINLINFIVAVVTFIPQRIKSFFGHSSFSTQKLGLRIAYILPFWPWKSVGTIIHQGIVIDKGTIPNSPWFGRTGSGSFAAYTIQNGAPAGAVEGIGGHAVITDGKINNPSSDSWASKASAICCWGLLPCKTFPIEQTRKLHNEGENTDTISGVILVAGSRTNTGSIPQKMFDAGVINAIGVDGGTSSMMGEGKNKFFECVWYKDKIQKYGLFCS